MRRLLLSALLTLVCSTPSFAQGRGGGRGNPIQPGEQCPPGNTEIRPRSCMAPEFAPPSIVDYRPKSTLIAPVHMVKTAKYPAIDFHGHPGQLITSPEG